MRNYSGITELHKITLKRHKPMRGGKGKVERRGRGISSVRPLSTTNGSRTLKHVALHG